jgi:hypothetical protein
VAQSYLQLLSVGLREQIITPHEVMNLVNGIAVELELQWTNTGEGFESDTNVEFGTRQAPHI